MPLYEGFDWGALDGTQWESYVKQVEGPVQAAGDAPVFRNQIIGRIEGDILADGDVFQNVFVEEYIDGDITTDNNVFNNAPFPLAVSGEIDATRLHSPFGDPNPGLVVADTIDVYTAEQPDGSSITESMTVITPRDDGFIDYTGNDWDGFKAQVRDHYDELRPLRVFLPEFDSVEGFEELIDIADERWAAGLGDWANVGSAWSAVQSYPDITAYRGMYNDLVAATLEEGRERKLENVEGFGEVLRRTDYETVFSYLRTDDADYDAGQDLFTIASGRAYTDALPQPESTMIDEVLNAHADTPRPSDFFEDDSPYRYALLDLLVGHGTDLMYLAGTASAAGEELSLDVASLLKKWEGERQHTGKVRDLDMEELDRKIEKEIDTKQRAYLSQAIQRMGRNHLADIYEEVAGERKDDFTEYDLAAFQMREAVRDNSMAENLVDSLLVYGDDIYHELPGAADWLSQHGWTADDIRDPDLSAVVDNEERIPDDGRRSALLVSQPGAATKQYEVRVSTPMETLLLGDGFNSCLQPESYGEQIAQIAANPNVVVGEAYDMAGNKCGRFRTYLTEDGVLTPANDGMHANDGADPDQLFQGYLETLADGMAAASDHDIAVTYRHRHEYNERLNAEIAYPVTDSIYI